jgi:DNA-binding CsgD family transcriptional regulator
LVQASRRRALNASKFSATGLWTSFQPLNANQRRQEGLQGPVHFCAAFKAAVHSRFSGTLCLRQLDKRLFVRDLAAHALLKASLDDLTNRAKLKSLISEPVIVQRPDKLPVIVRIWPFGGSANVPNRDVQALVTLSELGPKPGPSATILAKTFRLTPSEAKVASTTARGASPQIAARELKISRETARNQLKSVFAKTDTHRQSELVWFAQSIGVASALETTIPGGAIREINAPRWCAWFGLPLFGRGALEV